MQKGQVVPALKEWFIAQFREINDLRRVKPHIPRPLADGQRLMTVRSAISRLCWRASENAVFRASAGFRRQSCVLPIIIRAEGASKPFTKASLAISTGASARVAKTAFLRARQHLGRKEWRTGTPGAPCGAKSCCILWLFSV